MPNESMKKNTGFFYFIVIFFFIGLMIGVVFVNLSCKNRAAEDFMLNRSMLLQVPQMEIDRKRLFAMILENRLKWFLFFGLLIATPLAHRSVYLFGLWLGYGAGSLLTLAVVQYRALGLLVFLAAVLPQAVFLVPGGFGMINWLWGIRNIRDPYYKRSRLKVLSSFLLFSAMIFLGIFLECYVNPFVLSVFVKIFL